MAVYLCGAEYREARESLTARMAEAAAAVLRENGGALIDRQSLQEAMRLWWDRYHTCEDPKTAWPCPSCREGIRKGRSLCPACIGRAVLVERSGSTEDE